MTRCGKDYDVFADEVKKALHTMVGSEYVVIKKTIEENNGVKDIGLSINRKRILDGMPTISPSPLISLEDYYELHREYDFPMKNIAIMFHTFYNKYNFGVDNKASIKIMKDFEDVQSSVVYQLVSYEKNTGILSNMPHIRWLDLAITFHYIYDHLNDGIKSLPIKNGRMNGWGIEINDLYRTANSNMDRYFPVKIMSLADEVKKIKDTTPDEEKEYYLGIEYELNKLDEDKGKQDNWWVISNNKVFYGASTMIYPNLLKGVAERFGCDILVLPNSVHRLILLPVRGRLDIRHYKELLRNSNKFDIPPKDFLSHKVYMYRVGIDDFDIY